MKKIALPLSMLAIFSQAISSDFLNSESIKHKDSKLSEIVLTSAGPQHPVAVNDLWVYDDIIRPVIIPVLENDRKGDPADAHLDPSSLLLIDPFTGARVTSVTKTGYGTLTVLPDGQVRFEPESYVKPVTFEYVVSDMDGDESNVATIQIDFAGLPVPGPSAYNDVYHYGDVYFPETIPILNNDMPDGMTGFDIDPTSVRLIDPTTGDRMTSVTKPGYGTLTVLSDGQVRFEPQFSAGSSVTFDYVVSDVNGGESNVATIQIDVMGFPMLAPFASNDLYQYGDVYFTVTIPILANDVPHIITGFDIDPASVRLIDPTTSARMTTITKPGYGTLTVLPDGQVRFEPQFSAGSNVAFNYVVSDVNGSESNIATIQIDLLGLPMPAPFASNDLYQYGDAYYPVTIPILANDMPGDWVGFDIDPTSVRLIDPTSGARVTSVTKPGYGTLTVLSDGQVSFEPQFSAGSNVTFNYVVSDVNGSESNVATIQIDVLGLPMTGPIASNDAYHYGNVYFPVTIPILDNDIPGQWVGFDIDPASVRLIDPTTGDRVTSVAKAGYGTLAVLPDGKVRFEPQFTAGRSVTFDYVVSDITNTESNVGTLEIDVTLPLPVTLVSFNVSRDGKTTLLNWSTTKETNSDRFLIQRSLDGKNWKPIGTVKASGESKTIQDYAFTDATPQGGENLYRLKMIDLDESYSLSSIRSVRHNDMLSLVAYPNPASNKLLIENYQDVKQLDLYNLSGVKVYGSNNVPKNGVDVSRFSPGIYTLCIINSDGTMKTIKVAVAR